MVEKNFEPSNNLRFQIVEGTEELVSEQIEKSISFYESYRSVADRDLKIGLYGEDIEKSLINPKSFLIKYENESAPALYVPLLVPIDKLEWYNQKILKEVYGTEKKLYYYAHPPVLSVEAERNIAEKLAGYIEKGYVIFTDRYLNDSDSARILTDLNDNYEIKKIGTKKQQSGIETFAGVVKNIQPRGIFQAPSFQDVYDELLNRGELRLNKQNGVALADTIEGEEADKIWNFYREAFEKLGKDHPSYAGFDETTLKSLLTDPGVVKVVNRVGGKISTLCLFVQDFNHCPWFNNRYYQQHYPDYFSTNNILIFPGIVTDPSMQGQNYSLDVIKLSNRLMAERGSDFLITFECTEVSARYIPKIVKNAVETSGYSKIYGLDTPTTKIDYIGVSKHY